MFEGQLPAWAPLHTATHRAKVSLVRRKWHRCDHGGVGGDPHTLAGKASQGLSRAPECCLSVLPRDLGLRYLFLLPSLKNVGALSSTGVKASGTKQRIPAIMLHLGSHQESV